MKSRLLTAVRRPMAALALCATIPTMAQAGLLSSYTFGSPASLTGTQTTLNDLLPARFQLIYGNAWLCDDSECSFPYRNPSPPDAIIFDIEIAGPMSQTFVLNSGADFDAVAALATDGDLDPMNWTLDYLNGAEGYTIGGSESGYYDTADDLSGFNISAFELVMDATFDSPGRDPNGDGFWVDRNVHWEFNVYGSPVPIPPALYLFGTGLVGLVGVARKEAG